MPRYYLHVCDGSVFAEDGEGVELEGVAAARDHAIAGLRDVMAAELKSGGINLASFIEIEDENRRLLETVSFTDAVSLAAQVVRPPRT